MEKLERDEDYYGDMGCAAEFEIFIECFADNTTYDQGHVVLDTKNCALGLLPDCDEEQKACLREWAATVTCVTLPR